MRTKTKSIVLFGDSMFGRFGKIFIKKLETKLKKYTVYNCAAGGLNSDDAMRMADFISKLRPDYVAISLGANDAAPWKTKKVPLTRFKKNFEKILKHFSKSKIIVLLCPPAHDKNDPIETKTFNKAITPYNHALVQIAKKYKIIVINSDEIYKKHLESEIDFHDADGLHLNELGYELLIDELASIISK